MDESIIGMPRSSDILDVLIASPSDVTRERDILTEVILDWNSAHSRAVGVTLSAVRWETNAVPATGDRPQGLLNKQIVEGADIVLGVFWYRLGTPTGLAPSGTAEEIEIMRKKGKRVLLYFSEAPIPHNHDPEQLSALKRYRNSMEKNTLYWTFSSPDELRRLASKHLAAVINETIPTVLSSRLSGTNLAESSTEIDLRADAVNVSAGVTHSGGDFFSFVLKNESNELIVVKEIRLFSIDRHSLAHKSGGKLGCFELAAQPRQDTDHSRGFHN